VRVINARGKKQIPDPLGTSGIQWDPMGSKKLVFENGKSTLKYYRKNWKWTSKTHPEEISKVLSEKTRIRLLDFCPKMDPNGSWMAAMFAIKPPWSVIGYVHMSPRALRIHKDPLGSWDLLFPPWINVLHCHLLAIVAQLHELSGASSCCYLKCESISLTATYSSMI
jgi:hypothetical protein